MKEKTKNNIPEGAKLRPQVIELEEAVLGALMIEKEALPAIEDILSPESFYKDAHQKIYSAIKSVAKSSVPVDILTVANELKNKGELESVGGPFYIATLTNRVASAANIEFHSRIIQQKFLQRELIRVCGENIRDAYDDINDIFETIEVSERKISQLNEQKSTKSFTPPPPILKEILRRNDILLDKTKVLGVTSGFRKLDEVTAGWQKSDLIVIAGRPGMGKTAFAISLAINAARSGSPVAFFSIEMSETQITSRALSIVSDVPLNSILRTGVEGSEMKSLQQGIAEYEDLPIYIDDTGGISITELRKKARKAVKEKGVQIIFIDYLHLVTDNSEKGANREQQISNISRNLKALAKELNVPIIELSQLSRSVDTRGGNRVPVLSDLRESGAIEQDADMVMFIYRPEYYGLDEWNGKPTKGVALIVIAKHRNGALEDVQLGFKSELTKFTNYGEIESYPPTSRMSANTDFDKSTEEPAF